MWIANHGVSRLGNNVRLFINVNREDVFGSHGTHPVLDRTGNAACKVNIRRDARAGLTHLVSVIAPAIVGYSARTTNDAIQQPGQFF